MPPDSPLKVAGADASCSSKAQGGWQSGHGDPRDPRQKPGPSPTHYPTLPCMVGIKLTSVVSGPCVFLCPGVATLRTTCTALTTCQACSKRCLVLIPSTLSSSFERCKNRGTKRVSNLPEVTLLVSDRQVFMPRQGSVAPALKDDAALHLVWPSSTSHALSKQELPATRGCTKLKLKY